MNLKAITTALLIAGLAAPAAFATTGTITFTGSISTVTCSIHGDDPTNPSPDFTVRIDGVNAGDMPNVGDTAGLTGFRIFVGQAGETTCTDGTKVWAHFEPGATVDPVTGGLRTTGTATGVQYRLFDKLMNRINPWDQDQGSIKETIANNQAVLAHAAAFERTGSVTAGTADSSVTYSVRFEP